jgi:hypothetical protein
MSEDQVHKLFYQYKPKGIRRHGGRKKVGTLLNIVSGTEKEGICDDDDDLYLLGLYIHVRS